MSSSSAIAWSPMAHSLESKEAIGGYFLLDVASFDDAVAIAQECPGLPYGVKVEVRPVAAECPVASELKRDAHFAHA